MASNILSVGQSALAAAQVGLSTTGHNIANAATPGYSRQIVIQSAVAGENSGYGFLGKGTEVTAVRRVYSDYLSSQVTSAQTNKAQLGSYYTQIQQINNVLADPTAGMSPALQDFFKGVQDLSADPNGPASRQSMLSSAESLAGRFQSLSGQINEISQGVNSQITSSVGIINVYAQQIATLNDAIEKAQSGANGDAANDLLDQRDHAVAELSKEVKVTLVKQGDTYNVFIGNGQPLVVNTKTFNLAPAISPTDPSRVEVAYQNNGSSTILAESAFAGGGKLGGLFDFRAKTVDSVQNALGRVATVLGMSFNAQHELGQDQTGAAGGKFFNVAAPLVSPSTANTGSGAVTATITNANALTASDYRLQYVPASGAVPESYKVTRLSDGAVTSFPPPSATVDGVKFSVTGTPAQTDDFLIRPTANGAAAFSVKINNTTNIAAAAPVRISAATANAGTGTVTAPVVGSTALMPAVTATYDSGSNTLSGFPSSLPVTVTVSGTSTTYPAGTPVPYTSGATVSFGGVDTVMSGSPADGATFSLGPPTAALVYNGGAKTVSGFPPNIPVSVQVDGATTVYAPGVPVPYTPGAKISFGGVSFTLSGTPTNGDKFVLSANTNGQGDNRNALLLGALQTANVLNNGTSTYQGAYAQMVNSVGNKTRELEATSAAADKMYSQSLASQQSESGVNLDEEAANLLRYQQSYQAAAKVMQTASQLFDVLLDLGR